MCGSVPDEDDDPQLKAATKLDEVNMCMLAALAACGQKLEFNLRLWLRSG